MQEKEKILIVHDTALPQKDEIFRDWVSEFGRNIAKTIYRLPGPGKQVVLSNDLPVSAEQVPEIFPAEYSAFIILMHEEMHMTKNLKLQFNKIFSYLKELHESVFLKKLIIILLDIFPLQYEMLEFKPEKIIRFYPDVGLKFFSQTKYFQSDEREYWLKLLEVIELFSYKLEPGKDDEGIKKNRTIVYVGNATPDLEDKRDLLINDLIKRGITVLPELTHPDWKTIDEDSILDLLEYSDMSIQLIGARFGTISPGHKIADIEREYNSISRYLEGESGRLGEVKRPHTRIIWMPHSISADDIRQDKFIQRIKSQISYLKGNTELITGSFEHLKELVLNSLRTRISHSVKMDQPKGKNLVYIIHERSITKRAVEIAKQLRNYPLQVVLTDELYTETGFIKNHTGTLANCDAVVIFYGLDNLLWYESTIKDVIKIGKSKRTEPFKYKIVVSTEELLYKLPRYEDYIYIDADKLSSLNEFYSHLSKMIG